jgi:PIN domain nuclease of toxin-antitoxin system
MKLLLDTHAFLWAISGAGLSVAAQQAFIEPENSLYLSAASYWEICIKSSLGKLVLSADWRQKLDDEMAANQILWLPVEKEHCQRVVSLPFLHGDPFDRMLIAQALCESMTLVTADGNIKHYPVPILW